MKILYIADIRLPTEKAHGLQIMKTCEALAKAGATLELVVPTRHNTLPDDPFSYYDVQKVFTLTRVRVPDLIIFGQVGVLTALLLFSERVRWLRRFWHGDVIYSRDHLVLLQYLLLGRSLVFEAHAGPTFFARLVARRAHRVVVISKALGEAYRAVGVASECIVLAPDAVDLAAFARPQSKEDSRRRLGLPLDAKIAMYIGRLDGWKGVDTFCAAAALLSAGTQAVIIGGEPKQAADFTRRYPQVMFLGFRPYHELPDNQAAADVLVLPNTGKDETSVHYTSPLKLFTYMAAERPIVASDLPSIREVLDDSSCYFCPPDNPQALARAINVALTDGSSLSRAAVARAAVGEYTWEGRGERILHALAT